MLTIYAITHETHAPTPSMVGKIVKYTENPRNDDGGGREKKTTGHFRPDKARAREFRANVSTDTQTKTNA